MTITQSKFSDIGSPFDTETVYVHGCARPQHLDYHRMGDPEMLCKLGDGDWNLGWENDPGICITAEQRQMILDEVFEEFAEWIAGRNCYKIEESLDCRVKLVKRTIFMLGVYASEATLGDWAHEYTGDMQSKRLDGDVSLHWTVYGDLITQIVWEHLTEMIWRQMGHDEHALGFREIQGQLLDEECNFIAIFRSMWALICQFSVVDVLDLTGGLIVRRSNEISAWRMVAGTPPPQVIVSPVFELSNSPIDSVLHRMREMRQGG